MKTLSNIVAFPAGRRRPGNARVAFAFAMLLCGSVLQACGTRDGMSTGSIPDDYRTRHPITLSEAEHTLDIPVASGDNRLTIAVTDTVRGFAANYTANSTGTVYIQRPSGSGNSVAAGLITRQVRQVLVSAGIPAARIVETAYSASPDGDAAPIRLGYVAVTAMTGQCGNWPEDLTNNTFSNRNWHNFGCATQNNLAAQIANPMDLAAPRGMTPIDAERRSTVIGTYRTSGSSGETN